MPIFSFYYFLIFVSCLFLSPYRTFITLDYQLFAKIQQIIKKKIKIIVGTYTLGGVLIDLGYAAKNTPKWRIFS